MKSEDVRNKLSPISNLINIIEAQELFPEPGELRDIFIREKERSKLNILHLSSIEIKPYGLKSKEEIEAYIEEQSKIVAESYNRFEIELNAGSNEEEIHLAELNKSYGKVQAAKWVLENTNQ